MRSLAEVRERFSPDVTKGDLERVKLSSMRPRPEWQEWWYALAGKHPTQALIRRLAD